jgi:hypothetical protein
MTTALALRHSLRRKRDAIVVALPFVPGNP